MPFFLCFVGLVDVLLNDSLHFTFFLYSFDQSSPGLLWFNASTLAGYLFTDPLGALAYALWKSL